jgi:hypothetical protein
MNDLSAVVSLRPARIALLVRPNDLPSIRRFMRVSACMWGGMFNPIIPVFRNPPREWRREFKSETSGFAIAKGYIEFFEPDAFVLAEPGLLEAAGIEGVQGNKVRLGNPTILLKDLLKPEPHRDWSELLFGQTMIDALRDVYEKEQRFSLREKRLSYIVSPDRGSALAEAVFGVYPTEKPARYFGSWYEDVYKPEKLRSGPEAWRKAFSGAMTPLLATRYGIDIQRSWQNETVIFVFDPKHTTDLIDLWNMRLEPNPVLPIPVDWFPELANEVAGIISAAHRPLQGNPNGVMQHATIEFSRSISQHQATTIVNLIRPKLPQAGDANKGPGPLVLKPWRNPVWELHDGQTMSRPSKMKLRVKERRLSLSIQGETGLQTSFESLSPDFAAQYGGRDLRWVNSVRLNTFGKDRVATIFPFNTMERSWPRLSISVDDVLVGTEGWSFAQRYKDSTQHVELMSHETAVIGSLKRVGIDAELSEPGHIAKQMLEHLHGLWGVSLIADVETLELLNTMAGGIRRRRSPNDDNAESEQLFDRRSKPLQNWTALISRRSTDLRGSRVTLDKFTERNILRLGIETNCPHCNAANWHGIDVANYELTCERCLKKYPFPQANLRTGNRNWAYRVIGPFSVPDFARGAYGALLAIKAISRTSFMTSDNSLTFSTALSLNFGDEIREADYVAWYADNTFDEVSKPDLLIGEAKSLGDGELITARDVARMKDIGKRLPGSMLIFSVLRDDFTETEKKLLRRFVKWARRLDVKGGPSNRVLLLTGTEMFEVFLPLEHVWKKKGGNHAAFAEFHKTKTLRAIADSTVSIYLGIPSFEDEQFAAWEKRKKKRQDQKRTFPRGAKIGRMLIAAN